MGEVDRSRLSSDMLKDVEDYERTREDAIFWLGSHKQKSYKDIITRLQSSNINLVALSGVKTINEWSRRPSLINSINTDLVPVNNDNGVLKYSCYALKDTNSHTYGIRILMVESYASKRLLLMNSVCPNYSSLINKITKTYNIKVSEQLLKKGLVNYKPKFPVLAKIKSAGYKVLNLCRKFFNKEQIVEPLKFSGKILLQGYIYDGRSIRYVISKAEKLTEVLDKIMRVTANHFNKVDKIGLSKKELLITTLYADILMNRALNYGNAQLNGDIEDALKLQFSNALAESCPSVDSLDKISSLGMKCAIYNLKKMGISIEDVVTNAKNIGFSFANAPSSYEQALLGYKAGENTLESEDVVETKVAEFETTQEKSDTPINLGGFANFVTNTQLGNNTIYTCASNLNTQQYTIAKDILNKENVETNNTVKEVANATTVNEEKVRKYIDNVIKKAMKNYLGKTVVNMSNCANPNGKVYNKIKRRHLFIEGMFSYYENSKKFDLSDILEDLRVELELGDNTDSSYARKYGNLLLKTREEIIEAIFESGKDYSGKTVSELVNQFANEKYEKNSLATFISSVLNKSLKDIDELKQPTKPNENLAEK